MYCKRIPGFVSVFAILLNLSATAQEKNENIKKDAIPVPSQDSAAVADSLKAHPKKSYAGLAFSYVNDNIYQGRKDSLPVPYFTPKIGYYHKSGLFVEAAIGVNASSNNSGIDLFSFDAGYSFTAGNYEGELTATKLSYNSNSANVKSEMTGTLEYLNAFDLGFIKPTVQGAINFGTKNDYAASFGLEHSFYAINDKLEITPTAIANASTQNYYNSYYKARKYNPKRKAKLLPVGVASISGEVLNAAAFKVLDYELSLPIHFESGKFTFGLIPVYAIPVHPAQVVLTTTLNNGTVKTRTATESISNNFFGTLELLIKF
jgi:hypothetical protein